MCLNELITPYLKSSSRHCCCCGRSCNNNVNYVTSTCSNKFYTKYLQSLVAVGVVKGHVCAGLDPTQFPAVLLRHWGHLQCGARAVRVKGQGQIYIIFKFIL